MNTFRRSGDARSDQAQVFPFRPAPSVADALRSMSSSRADDDNLAALDLVTRAAEAVEAAERNARRVRADAQKFVEDVKAEFDQAQADLEDLRLRLAAKEADARSADLRAREADVRIRELTAQNAALQARVATAEDQVAVFKKWLAFFDGELAKRFEAASRSLEEMGALTFG
jgi:chromosome segregation ATPase